eukprot:TRINITY_DN886_c0_g1_i2.p1 TRINITY_DN886_c0_g1~~TRINITY_DN886_c0_g1_i2.p1  ORF type:complete len:488 (-),score=223.51 TRINITY_DN886_c0_g1_i2:110-1573(-)
MALKRKAITKGNDLFKGAKAAKKHQEEAEEHEENDAMEQEEEEEEPEVEQKSEKEIEQETVASRRKELKAMAVGDIKDLVTSHGLDTGNKADMIEALLTKEAKARAAQRAHEAEVRQVVSEKKEELEAMPAPELKGLCDSAGLKGAMAKPARVEALLKQWLAEGGVDKAMAKKVRDAREEKLVAMDKNALRKLSDKLGVDCYVMDVVIERIVKREGELGHFDRPKFEEETVDDDKPEPKGKAKDMIGALLAGEASKKKEKEARQQEEEAAANRRKELKAKSLDELKKLLTKKGKDATGKKDELVDAVCALEAAEKAQEAKRAKLRALPLEDLKQRVASKGLTLTKKEAMVDGLLAHEAEQKEKALAYEKKVEEAMEKVKEELQGKTAAELKDMCAAKNLRLGVGKPDRLQTLAEAARASGEVDKVIAAAGKRARREELMAMEKAAVLKICDALEVDGLVKEVMVERLLAHEEEPGCIKVDEKKKRSR